MKKENKILKTIIRLLGLIIFCAFLGTVLLTIVYSLPTGRLIDHAINSISIYSENIITQWAGWSRYSHISNSTDTIMLGEAICREYNSPLINALLNPRYTYENSSGNVESFINYLSGVQNYEVINYPRYWHGYLLYIIPSLFFTDAGGIRTIMMIIQFFLTVVLIYEIGKKNKLLIYLYACVALFINPITTSLTFQDADIYMIMQIFSIVILKYNDWLNKNDRYVLLFTLNGILTCFFDFLTYPLVAWGIPLSISIILNKDDLKNNIKKLLTRSLSWVFGYAGMWISKWLITSLITNENLILQGINQVVYRSSGDHYSFMDTLIQLLESFIDIPMIVLLLITLIVFAINIFKNKKIYSPKIYNIIPLLIVGLVPFVWFFLVRNHSYIHPWLEYRQLAVTLWSILLVIFNLFENSTN